MTRAIDQERKIVRRAFDPGGAVVLRDGAADDNARSARDLSQHSVKNVAADVVEVDVNTLGAMFLQGGANILRFVVNSGVEAEVLCEIAAFLRASGDANHVAALDPGDLTYHHADRARSAGDDYGLSCLRLAYIQQSEIGGHAGHAERSQINGQGARARGLPS